MKARQNWLIGGAFLTLILASGVGQFALNRVLAQTPRGEQGKRLQKFLYRGMAPAPTGRD